MSRSLRRHHADRIKVKAARMIRRWARHRDPMIAGHVNGVVKYYTAQEMQRNIGRQAAMHCTHICDMCHHEKKFNLPRRKHETQRIIGL